MSRGRFARFSRPFSRRIGVGGAFWPREDPSPRAGFPLVLALEDMGVEFRRWGVFNAVASGGFLLQIAVIALLTRRFGWSPMAATFVGVELAALQNFLGHTRWTWRDHPAGGAWAGVVRYGKYQVAKTASLGLNVLITLLMVKSGRMPVELANAIAVVVCSLPNYFAFERLVFARQPKTVGHS
jgi:putative flippase GtrA